MIIDARGLRCPLPVLRLAQRLPGLPPGSRVEVLSTDPASATDIPAFCRIRGLTYLGSRADGDHTAYVVVTATDEAAGSAGPARADSDSPRAGSR